MIGEDLKSIIAAKIAAATGGGASATAGGPDPALAMACRIYIGSLYYDLTAQDITALFEGFGEVTKCEMQMDPATGRSKGFCFLEFRTPEQAQASMAMNGFEIAGRKVCFSRFHENEHLNGSLICFSVCRSRLVDHMAVPTGPRRQWVWATLWPLRLPP